MTGAPPDWRRQLQQAVDRHQRGDLDAAIGLYRGVLAVRPDNTDALHLIGMALEQAGHPDQGLPFVEAAIRRDPGISAYHNTLGTICKSRGDMPAAQAAYAAAVALDPANAEAHNNLGLLAQSTASWALAEEHFQAALAADPGYMAARFNLAATAWLAGRSGPALAGLRSVLAVAPGFAPQVLNLAMRSLAAKEADGAQQLAVLLDGYSIPAAGRHVLRGGIAALAGDTAAAEEAYRAALAVEPGHVAALGLLSKLLLEREAHAEALPLLERLHALQPDDLAVISGLGYALTRLAAYDKAVPFLRTMVERRPDEPGPWADLAQAYARQNNIDGACAAYRAAIALDPERAELYANLSGLEARRGDLDAAEIACNEALARDPASQAARGNLANIRGLRKQFDEAEALYATLLAEYPEDATSHNNLGIMRLRQERYAEAWPHFAWRWKSAGWTTGDGSRGLPRWDGQYPPPGRLLLWREQGVGDEILYSSLLPEMAAKGVDLVVATDKRLVPLFTRSFPAIRFVVDSASLDPAALQLACQRPLGDLGALVRPDKASFASQPTGYLRPDPQLRDRLRQRYRAALGPQDLLVGVAWSSRNAANGRAKSIALTDMAGLFGEPGLHAVSLQYGQVAEDIVRAQAATGLSVRHDPEIDPLASIDDQAAQIAALDLVVTISTAAAHLAAGLGLPTLILLPDERGVLWYWGHRGHRTPWYDTVRICRSEPGEAVSTLLDRAGPVWREMVAAARQRAVARG